MVAGLGCILQPVSEGIYAIVAQNKFKPFNCGPKRYEYALLKIYINLKNRIRNYFEFVVYFWIDTLTGLR